MLFVLGQRSLIRNKTQTAVTNMKLNMNKRIAKIEFHSLTYVSYVSTYMFRSNRKLKILKYIITV